MSSNRMEPYIRMKWTDSRFPHSASEDLLLEGESATGKPRCCNGSERPGSRPIHPFRTTEGRTPELPTVGVRSWEQSPAAAPYHRAAQLGASAWKG